MAMSVGEYKESLVRAIATSVDDLVDGRQITDFSSAGLAATVSAAEESIRTANRINGQMGPFYRPERVRQVLGGVSRQALSQRVRAGRLLRVETADGVLLYPAFQFSGAGLVPGMSALLQVLLSSGADGWTVAYWLTSTQGYLGGHSAVQVLAERDSAQVAAVMRQAREDAARWAGQQAA